MIEHSLSYREVIPDQTVSEVWKEINLNTGGTQSILQDIKFVDRANGFCYKDSTEHFTRNRFIYWRISNDTLELVEYSLDINLAGNKIRYKFIDTPILDGISVHETKDNVIVFVPTVCSVHRLVYPHPRKLHKSDDLLGIHSDISAPSIFSEANEIDARSNLSYFIFSGPNSQLPYLASSTLSTENEDGIFVLVYPMGQILLIRQAIDGQNYCTELKNESLVPRFLSGLAEKLGSRVSEGDNIVSLVLHSVDTETFAITLTRDAHLKFWSCSKVNCISVINVLSEFGYPSVYSSQGTQNHVLRKAVDGTEDSCLFALFIAGQNQFHIIKFMFNSGRIKINRLHSLTAPAVDLIDLNLTMSRIWSVWRSVEGDTKVFSTCLLQDGYGLRDWIPVILEDQPENQPPFLDDESDPSQTYLRYIFQPGRFSLQIINKALNTYKRSTISTDFNLSATNLKQRIATAVQNEIQKELKENEVGCEEYLQCANWCWERFYSCCVQYHAAGLKPLGILLLPGVSGAVLLKKSTFSFFRPLDTLEHMLLCNDYISENQFLQQSGLSEDVELIPDVLSLMEVIVYLKAQLSEIFGYIFEKELWQLKFPDVIMSELLEKILTEMDNEFMKQVCHMLNKCQDLYQAMHKLLELIRDAHGVIYEDGDKCDNNMTYLFTSQLGVSVVTQCLRQQAQVRFTICRNLLLVINILLRREELSWEILESIRSVCLPEMVVLTQASFVIYWLSGLSALPVLSHETILNRLAPLKFKPVFNLRIHNQTSSVLSLFIGSTGGNVGHKRFANIKNRNDLQYWHNSLLPYLSHLFHIIWPVSGCPILAEWLLISGQHVWLQQYVRLLSNWCEWNNCTRNFLLACSYLLTSENFKARELFESAVKGLFNDTFLSNKILKNIDEDDPTKAHVSYFLKVIQLFELNNADDYAIHIANTASSIVTSDDPLAATLHSIKFKHHLKLKHYKYAYDSLNSNPDQERKRDNLRDLVKCLLDEREFETLMTFNYGDLDELFQDILLSRARAVDVVDNTFYDLLYAYHVKRGPLHFFRGGSVMCEQAFRLSGNNNIDALEKQVKSFMAALNILRLCDTKDVRISRPKNTDISDCKNDETKIVDLAEIKREFEFASAKLKLARQCPQIYNNFAITNPGELLVALLSSGLYQIALNLCKHLDLSYELVFDHLTGQCIALTETSNFDHFKWLILNDTQDFLICNNNPSDVAWLYLRKMMEKYEEPGLTTLHKVICKKIIQMASFIPYWLWASYKVRNASELLRLLHRTGRLKEAVDIASKYMLAVMGHGKEYYGLEHSLSPTGPVVYCPVFLIENLVFELKLQVEHGNEEFAKDYEFLKDLLSSYLKTAERISNEMCKYKMAIAQQSQTQQCR